MQGRLHTPRAPEPRGGIPSQLLTLIARVLRPQGWPGMELVLVVGTVVTLFTAGTAWAQTPTPPPPPDPAPTGADAAPGPEASPPEGAEGLPGRPPSQSAPSVSESEKARGLPISAIEITGNRRITREDILSYLRERVSTPFVPSALTQDVRELWTSGFFEDIEVDLSRGDAGVTLRFMVRERPSIRKVEFEGNTSLKLDDLKEAIEIKSDTILSQPAVRRSIQKIRDKYAEKGYFLAEATAEVVPQKNNEVLVRFVIRENGQVTVRRITFIGNESIPDAELRDIMFTGKGSILSFGSGGPYRQDAFERDIAMLNSLYYERGFLEVSINTPRVMLTPDRAGIELSITIEEGARYRIRQLRVYERGADGREVDPINGRRNLRTMVRAKPGDIFNRSLLVDDLQTIRTLYRDHGFANVEANPQTRLDEKHHEVDVTVAVDRGPLVHYERIEFRGNTKTRERVLRREMEIVEGEVFNETLAERSRRRLTALGYFERVDISTEQGSAPDKLNVYVEVTERPTGTFQVGIGFSSIENFIATGQVQQANLFGRGQALSLQAQMSGLRQMVNLRFIEPYFMQSKFSTTAEFFLNERFYSDFSQSSRGGSLTFGYPLIAPRLVASLTYYAAVDKVSTGSTSSFLGTSTTVSVFRRLPLANLFQDGLTSKLGPTISYDSRDNRLFPTAGIYLRASTEFALAAFGSDNRFVRSTLMGRFYYPIRKGITLKLNAEGGHVTSPSQQGVPIFARYFLGGILDLRGFTFRSISPRLPLTSDVNPNSPPIFGGAAIGGNLMYVQNLELEFAIVESMGVRGVIFTDAGNTWNLEPTYCEAARGAALPAVQQPCFDGLNSLSKLRTSWGFGFRWFSPMGPLRFEWGFPFKPLPGERTNVFEFTIGNFF